MCYLKGQGRIIAKSCLRVLTLCGDVDVDGGLSRMSHMHRHGSEDQGGRK
jgi:hypothetical protein